MQGYLHGPRAEAPWRTGDLGHRDENGFLSVTGRKDNLLVTANGRNISPEWIEAMVMSDPRVAACVLLGHGMSHLSVLLVPSPHGEEWLMESPRAHILLWLEQICIDAPSYAVPKDFVVCPAAQAKRIGLLTSNGRVVREAALGIYPGAQARAAPRRGVRRRAIIPQAMEGQVSFYDRLIAETERERIAFTINSADPRGGALRRIARALSRFSHSGLSPREAHLPAARLRRRAHQGRGLSGRSRRIYGGGARPREMDPERHRGAWAATPLPSETARPGSPAR